MEVSKVKASMLDKYYKQPSHLPKTLENDLKALLGDQTLVFYSYVDLNNNYRLANQWLILGQSHLVFACFVEGQWALNSIALEQINKVSEVSSISHHKMIFEDAAKNVLMHVNYSLRQSKTMSSIKLLVEDGIKDKFQGQQELTKNPGLMYQEQVVEPIIEAQSTMSGSQQDVVWRLIGLLKPYRSSVALGMLGAVLMTLVSLVPAYLTGYIIDEVIKPFQAGLLNKEKALELGMFTILGLVVIYVFREFFAWVRLRKMTILGELVARDLRDKVYCHLQKLSLSFFNSKQTGSIISRVGSDTDRIWDFIAFGVVEVTTSLIMLTGLSIVLLFLDWRLGLLVTLPVPLLLWVIYKHGQHMQKLFLKAWRKWSDLTDCLSDTIPGIKVVKSFNKEKEETDKFHRRNVSVVKEFNNIHASWTRFWPFLMLTIQAIVISVWFFGVPRVLNHIEGYGQLSANLEGLSPGIFVSFVLYLGMFVHPIEVIGQMTRMVNRATSSAHRVFEILDTEPQIFSLDQAKNMSKVDGEIEFKNVVFSYDGVRRVLNGVSFKIKPGEMIGLVGPSGSGKTTITNLVARFFDALSGDVLIDGVNIKDIELGDFRQHLGIVLQDPYLFHGTILDNIRYACPDAELNDVIQASKAANAHDFICGLPHAYDTVVGERGHTLSGGERQRVSIARAILRNPKILILDEATSSVDTETEKKIQQALDKLVKGRTTIAIAHRLSTLSQADRLLVLKNGELVEEGKHSDLVKLEEGVYKKLVDMQQEMHVQRI